MARKSTQKLGNKAKGRQMSRHKAKYERQRIRTERNKAKRRKKHLERHPNDLQAQELYGQSSDWPPGTLVQRENICFARKR